MYELQAGMRIGLDFRDPMRGTGLGMDVLDALTPVGRLPRDGVSDVVCAFALSARKISSQR